MGASLREPVKHRSDGESKLKSQSPEQGLVRLAGHYQATIDRKQKTGFTQTGGSSMTVWLLGMLAMTGYSPRWRAVIAKQN